MGPDEAPVNSRDSLVAAVVEFINQSNFYSANIPDEFKHAVFYFTWKNYDLKKAFIWFFSLAHVCIA